MAKETAEGAHATTLLICSASADAQSGTTASAGYPGGRLALYTCEKDVRRVTEAAQTVASVPYETVYCAPDVRSLLLGQLGGWSAEKQLQQLILVLTEISNDSTTKISFLPYRTIQCILRVTMAGKATVDHILYR